MGIVPPTGCSGGVRASLLLLPITKIAAFGRRTFFRIFLFCQNADCRRRASRTMSSKTPTYPVSINPNIIGKPAEPGPVNYAKGWQPVDVTAEDLIGNISQGRAYSAQFVGGYRKTQNFIRCGILAADFDHGPSLEEALKHEFIQNYASFIHTTASHTAERNRYRAVFLLDKPVLDADDFSDALLGLALTMGSDRSATDSARMFFGKTDAIVHRIGLTLPPAVFADLRARGRDAREARSPRNGQLLPVNSSRGLPTRRTSLNEQWEPVWIVN
jgi:hypothetical protein